MALLHELVILPTGVGMLACSHATEFTRFGRDGLPMEHGSAFGDEPGHTSRLYSFASSSDGPWQAVMPERITDALLMDHRPTAVLHWAQPGWQGGDVSSWWDADSHPSGQRAAGTAAGRDAREVHRLNLATGRKELC